MNNIEGIPAQIMTTYFAISAVYVPADNKEVILFAVYGNMVTGEYESILVETEFDTFNRLLSIAEDAEHFGIDDIISKICDHISNPSKTNPIIQIHECGGLFFTEHVFSFQLITPEDDEEAEDPDYRLISFIPRGDIPGEFMEEYLPKEGEEKIGYYHKLLAVRYQLYLHHLKSLEPVQAAALANLADPVIFGLAEMQYNLFSGKGISDN